MRLKQQAPARLVDVDEGAPHRRWLWTDDGSWWAGVLGAMDEEDRHDMGTPPVRKRARRRPTIKTSTCVGNLAADAAAGAIGLCEVVFTSPCSVEQTLDSLQVELLKGGGSAPFDTPCISITATAKTPDSEQERHPQPIDVQVLLPVPNTACGTSFIRLVDSHKLLLLVEPCNNVAELLSDAFAHAMPTDALRNGQVPAAAEQQQRALQTSYCLAAPLQDRHHCDITDSSKQQACLQQAAAQAGGSMAGVVQLGQLLPAAAHAVVVHQGVDVAAARTLQQLPPLSTSTGAGSSAGVYPDDSAAWHSSCWLSSRLSAMLLPLPESDSDGAAESAGSSAAVDQAPSVLLPGGEDGMWRLMIALSSDLLPGAAATQPDTLHQVDVRDGKDLSLQPELQSNTVKQEVSADGQDILNSQQAGVSQGQGLQAEGGKQDQEAEPEEEGRRGWQDDILAVLRWLLPQYAHQMHGYYSPSGSSNPLLGTQCSPEDAHRHSGFSAARLYKAVKPQGTEPQFQGLLPQLVPTLRPYQKRAVSWMLSRELGQCTTDTVAADSPQRISEGQALAAQQGPLHPLWRCLVSLSGQQVYLNPFSGLLRRTAPAVPADGVHAVRGGILCDEMGLGKTVELLACILAHPLTPDATALATTPAAAAEDGTDHQRQTAGQGPEQQQEQQQQEQEVEGEHQGEVVHPYGEGARSGRAGQKRHRVKLVQADLDDEPARKSRRLGAKARIVQPFEGDGTDLQVEAKQQQGQLQPIARPAEHIDCPCGVRSADPSDDGDYTGLWVMCDVCCAWMHGACVGLKRAPTGTYVCSHCKRATAMQQVDSICGTTLIVCPAPILAQWWDEIAKHTQPGAVRVVVYSGQQQNSGVPSAGAWAAPDTDRVGSQAGGGATARAAAQQVWSAADLAAADIVLTTYDALKRDVDRQPELHVAGKQLRQQKRYQVVPTPLTRLTWWRVVLDEAQMVESSTAKAAAMALKLRAVHRWCVTGTPISRGLEDVYGLMAFLQAAPWRTELWWRRAIQRPAEAGCPHANARLLHSLCPALGGLMWRTAKQDVLDQLGIPPQHHHATWLFQSPVERHFYVRQHQECANRVRNVLPAGLLSAAARAARAHAAAAQANMVAQADEGTAAQRAGRSSTPDPDAASQQPSSRQGPSAHDASIPGLMPAAAETDAPGDTGMQQEAVAGSKLGQYELEQLNRQLTQLEQKRVLHPLLRLRQAACHPQVGAGGIKSISAQRAPMTMDEILQVLVTKAKVEAEEAQRKLMVALNGLAALMLLEQGDAGKPDAIATYREALHYMTVHKEDVRTDPLVQLHTFHNLQQLLSPTPPPGVPRTLRDSTLQAEADALRTKYLEQRINQLAAQQADYEKTVRNALPFDAHNSWFLTAIDMLLDAADEDTLVDNAKTMLLEQDALAVQRHAVNASSLSHRFKSLRQLKVVLVDALDGIEKTRKPAMGKLQELIAATSAADPTFVEQAGHCHRCREHLQRVGRVCEHCLLEELLVKWEVRLFAVHSKALVAGQRISAEEAASWAANAAVRRIGKGGLGEEGPAALQQLQQLMGMDPDMQEEAAGPGAGAGAAGGSSRRDEVQVAGAQIQWKPSEAELLLKFLASQLRQHCGAGGGSSSEGVSVATVLTQAKEHLEKLEAQRKLFAQARALSLAQRWLLYAHDELDMALARTRLRGEDEYVAEYEAAFKIQAAEIPIRNKELSDDKILALGDLTRTLGTLRYLRTLQAARQTNAPATDAAAPATIDLTGQAGGSNSHGVAQPAPAGEKMTDGMQGSAAEQWNMTAAATEQQLPYKDAAGNIQPTAMQSPGSQKRAMSGEAHQATMGRSTTASTQLQVASTGQGAPEAGDTQQTQHICPICHDPITTQFSMLPCGHMVCLDCMEMLVGGKRSAEQLLLLRSAGSTERHVQCPTCRRRTPLTEIAYVDGGTTHSRTVKDPSAGQPSNSNRMWARSLTVHTRAEGTAALLGLSLPTSPGKSPQQHSPQHHKTSNPGAVADGTASERHMQTADQQPQQAVMDTEVNLWEGEGDVIVSGSYGTKVEAVVRRIMFITRQDQDAKIIVFSAWLDLLELLAHALAANKVPHALAKARKGFQAALTAFKAKGGAMAPTPDRQNQDHVTAMEVDADTDAGMGSRGTSPAPLPLIPEEDEGAHAAGTQQDTNADEAVVMTSAQEPDGAGQPAGESIQPEQQAVARPKSRRGGRSRRTPTPPASAAANTGSLAPSKGPTAAAAAPRVLLLLMSQGGAGLNLTEAQHVVLVEPRTDPAPELQAIGRIHRIGQTRETHVHRFIMCHTVEENVYALGASHAADMDMGHGASSNSDAATKAVGKESVMHVCDVAMLLETPWEASGPHRMDNQPAAGAVPLSSQQHTDQRVAGAEAVAPADAVADPLSARRAAVAAAAEARWQQQQQQQQQQGQQHGL